MQNKIQKITSILLIALVILAIPTSISAEKNNLNVVLNGELLDLETSFFIHNNRIMIPIRPISESLQYNVHWDEENNAVLVKNQDNQLRLRVNDEKVKFNDMEITLDTKPFIKNGTTYFPINLISKIVKEEAYYDKDNQTVIIGTYNKDYNHDDIDFPEKTNFMNDSFNLQIPNKIKNNYIIKETEENTIEFYDKYNKLNNYAGYLFKICKTENIDDLDIVPGYLLEYKHDKGDYYVVLFASDVQYTPDDVRSEKIYNEQMNHGKEFLKSFQLNK